MCKKNVAKYYCERHESIWRRSSSCSAPMQFEGSNDAKELTNYSK